MMLHIALTGNAASGKSTVARIMSGHGASVISTDAINTSLMVHSRFITRWLGKFLKINLGTSDESDIENKRIIRERIFSNKDSKKMVEHLLHPIIMSNAHLQSATSISHTYQITEVPLLFESGLYDLFDAIILVTSSHDVALNRMTSRARVSHTTSEAILKSQGNVSDKLRPSSHIINNDGDMQTLNHIVDILHDSILNDHKRRSA